MIEMIHYEKKIDEIVTDYGFVIKKKQYRHVDDISMEISDAIGYDIEDLDDGPFVKTLYISVNGRFHACVSLGAEESGFVMYDKGEEKVVARKFEENIGAIVRDIRYTMRKILGQEVEEIESLLE